MPGDTPDCGDMTAIPQHYIDTGVDADVVIFVLSDGIFVYFFCSFFSFIIVIIFCGWFLKKANFCVFSLS